MSADLLRRAAALLRKHAGEAQHQEPWCKEYTWAAVRHVQRNCDLEVECAVHPDPQACDSFGMYDGRYVAMMHPPVALALADLLDDISRFAEANDVPGPQEIVVTLARAILREEAS